MDGDLAVFGDLHLGWKAAGIIMDETRKLGIDVAFNLGDEDTLCGAMDDSYDRLFGALRDFRDGNPRRRLVCLIGDKTGGVPRDLKRNYVGAVSHGKHAGSLVFREGNIIAAHDGHDIMKEFGTFIHDYRGDDPLMVFHGHSHSMGVLPEYRWLSRGEMVRFIPEGELTVPLEKGKVYWANPGAAYLPYATEDFNAANFLVYSPSRRLVILKSIFYKRSWSKS